MEGPNKKGEMKLKIKNSPDNKKRMLDRRKRRGSWELSRMAIGVGFALRCWIEGLGLESGGSAIVGWDHGYGFHWVLPLEVLPLEVLPLERAHARDSLGHPKPTSTIRPLEGRNGEGRFFCIYGGNLPLSFGGRQIGAWIGGYFPGRLPSKPKAIKFREEFPNFYPNP